MWGSILAWALMGTGASASAATTIGQAPPTLGTPGNCDASALVQTSVSSGPDYVAPSSGIITSWRSSLNGTVEFSTFRPAPEAGSFQRISADPRTGNGTLTTFNARVPVLAGDRIGLRPTASSTNCLFATGDNDDVVGIGGVSPVGGPPETYSPGPASRLNLAAVIEADADGDGFGDETQDGCPTDATTQAACPTGSDTTAPDTTITSGPKKTDSRKVKFGFASSEAGSTFRCKLTGKGVEKDSLKQFAPCKSKKTYKRLKPGKYTFFVVASDAAGNVDPTPAKQRFKIVE